MVYHQEPTFDSGGEHEEFEMPVVRRYGSSEDNEQEHTDGTDGPHVGESSALLGVDAAPKPEQRDGTGSMVGSVSNLANTIIGSGACIAASSLNRSDLAVC